MTKTEPEKLVCNLCEAHTVISFDSGRHVLESERERREINYELIRKERKSDSLTSL